jgi:exodeoxyribonuclease VII large subunit
MMRLSRPAQVVHRHAQTLEVLEHRTLAACRQRVRWAGQRLPVLQDRLHRAANVRQARLHHGLDAWDARLHALNPRKVLERGYAWLGREDGQPITQVAQARVGDALAGVMADGLLRLRVTHVEPDPPSET